MLATSTDCSPPPPIGSTTRATTAAAIASSEKAAAAAAGEAPAKPARPVPVASPSVPAADATMANTNVELAQPGDGKTFTLQMKAFSRAEEAEAFASKLRANGHQVRVEAHEVKGRIWHRVRLGSFDNWADGLAAKEDFERREKIIAYVVRN